jgi:hypothetical protein
MNPEANRLREQVAAIADVRRKLIIMEVDARKEGYPKTARAFDELESWLINIEDEIDQAADRLDPPPTRYTGQQWLAGLTRRAGQ